jgi:hypothetical protein
MYMVMARFAALLAALLIAGVALPAQQQKPATPTPSAPKPSAKSKALGRTPDGQPDVSGVWGNAEHGTWTVFLEDHYYLVSKQGMVPVSGPKEQVKPGAPGSFFAKRPTAIVDPRDGILPYQPWALERRNSVMRNYHSPEPWQVDTQTPGWPTGIPREMSYSSTDGFYGGPIQILQAPGYVVILHETHHEFRIIPLDGRPQPGQNIKLTEGSSRGRWEGNTLVVDVANNNDSPRMSVIGDFRSDQMRATERWTFVDHDNFTYRVTINDPKVFTRPWTMELLFTRAPAGTELMEYAGVEGAAPFFGYTRPDDSRNHIK